MATIQSATGPLDTADMGFTLMHEHVMVTWPPYRMQYPEAYDRGALLGEAVRKLLAAREAGVRTIVDLTPIDLGRDPIFIKDAAEQSGMQVIVPTGFYFQIPFRFVGRRETEMVETMVRDITVGISTTDIRANVIKCATEPDMHPANERVLRASARAHRETGVPICTHTVPANRTGLDQQRVFKEEGVDLGRTVIGHSDDTDDLTYLEQIIENGSYCGMDRIGIPRPRTSEQRADMVAALCAKGLASRITLSHDTSGHIDFFTEGFIEERWPEWSFTYIPTGFSELLRERGVSDADIEQMTVHNPRAIFEKTGAY
jgi:phosphotriesterase-related protein